MCTYCFKYNLFNNFWPENWDKIKISDQKSQKKLRIVNIKLSQLVFMKNVVSQRWNWSINLISAPKLV